jgi:hypothetical protein
VRDANARRVAAARIEALVVVSVTRALRFDLTTTFSQLRRKERMTVQMVTPNFPTASDWMNTNPFIGATDDWYLGWPMKARHGPPRVGTMIWASRAALGADGRVSTDRVMHKR